MRLKKNTIFMKNKVKQLLAISLIFFYGNLLAKENVSYPGMSNTVQNKIAAACSPSTSQTDLDVNNVRTTILGGGDMWWDLVDAQYEIPKGSYKNSVWVSKFFNLSFSASKK